MLSVDSNKKKNRSIMGGFFVSECLESFFEFILREGCYNLLSIGGKVVIGTAKESINQVAHFFARKSLAGFE